MSSFDFNFLLRSPTGKLKLAAVIVGLLAVVFCVGGYKRHIRNSLQFWSAECEWREADKRKAGITSTDGYFEECVRFGFAKAGIAFVIIPWLFSLEIMAFSAMPLVIEQPPMRTIDAFGHLGAGTVDILGFLLVIVYTYNIYAFSKCNDERKSDETKSFCIKTVFWQGVWKGASDDEEANGYLMLLWILGALLSVVHGILCFLIYPQAVRARKTGPLPMIMVNPSSNPQVAPVIFPNKEEFQQQTVPMPPPPAPPPEEEEEAPPAHVHRHHHSKHSHKDKKDRG